MKKYVLLTFDLEEFDIPEEYGAKIPLEDKIKIGKKAVLPILSLLDKYNARATFYTTAFFAEKEPLLIRKIAEKHEIASHSYYHSSFSEEDLSKSKQKLEELSGKKVNGFRMPRLQPFDKLALKKAGYLYDSSMNPTYLPGRYNHLNKPKTLYKENGIYILPTTVSPVFRIPLFWLLFKNINLTLYNFLAYKSLKKYGYINLYFHPWEFTNEIANYDLPFYIKSKKGVQLLNKLDKFMLKISNKPEVNFITTSKLISKIA